MGAGRQLISDHNKCLRHSHGGLWSTEKKAMASVRHLLVLHSAAENAELDISAPRFCVNLMCCHDNTVGDYDKVVEVLIKCLAICLGLLSWKKNSFLCVFYCY